MIKSMNVVQPRPAAPLYNAIHGLPSRSAHTLARLKQLFHESEGLPATSKVLLRPNYQWRCYDHQTIYRRTPGTGRLLHAKGIFDPPTMRWANTTRILHRPRQRPRRETRR